MARNSSIALFIRRKRVPERPPIWHMFSLHESSCPGTIDGISSAFSMDSQINIEEVVKLVD